MGANYSVYKLPYISSAIAVNTNNLQSCLSKATSSELRDCITSNVTAKVSNWKIGEDLNVTYFGQGETVSTGLGTKTITPASNLPNSNCHENFNNSTDNAANNESSNVNIESNKIFCFNGTFTILTIFVLLMLLIFININYKNPVIKNT
jgi:hypothetical protein